MVSSLSPHLCGCVYAQHPTTHHLSHTHTHDTHTRHALPQVYIAVAGVSVVLVLVLSVIYAYRHHMKPAGAVSAPSNSASAGVSTSSGAGPGVPASTPGAPGFHRQADNQVVAHLSVWPSASRGQCLAVFARDVASRLVPLSVEVSTLQLSSYPSAGVSTLGTRDSETVDSAMVTGLNCLNHLQAPSSFRPSPPSQAQRGRL